MQISELQKDRGFSLVEALIAMVILGVGLVGVSQMQGNLFKGSTQTKQRIDAINLAQEKIEQLSTFADVDAYNALVNNLISGDVTGNDTPATGSGNFARSWIITVSDGGNRTNINVKVTWPDPDKNGNVSSNTTVQLGTMVSNTVPNTLALTDIGPAPSTTTGPGSTEPTQVVSVVVPTDPCTCSTSTTVVNYSPAGSGFVKVGMGMGGMGGMSGGTSSSPPSSSTQTSLNTSDCNLCCTQANAIGWVSTDDGIPRYAQSQSGHFRDVGDRVINQRNLDGQWLKKTTPTFRGRFFQLAGMSGGMSGGGMSGGGMSGGGTTTVTTTKYAYCSIIVDQTVTTATQTRRANCMRNWSVTN